MQCRCHHLLTVTFIKCIAVWKAFTISAIVQCYQWSVVTTWLQYIRPKLNLKSTSAKCGVTQRAVCGVQRAVCSVQRAACSNCCERGVGRQGLRESGQCCAQLQDDDDPHQNQYLKLRKQCSGCAGEHPPIYDSLAYKTAPTFMCCVHLCPTMYTTTAYMCCTCLYILKVRFFVTDRQLFLHSYHHHHHPCHHDDYLAHHNNKGMFQMKGCCIVVRKDLHGLWQTELQKRATISVENVPGIKNCATMSILV